MSSTEQIIEAMRTGQKLRAIIDVELTENEGREIFTATAMVGAGEADQVVGTAQAADYGTAHGAAASIATTVVNRYSVAARMFASGPGSDRVDSEAIGN